MTTKGCRRNALRSSPDGLFTGYLSNRELASAIGETRSNGTMRTESWNRLPMIRMTNISINPGDMEL